MTQPSPVFDIYRGDGQTHADLAAALPDAPMQYGEQGKYIAEPELAEAVNIAIAVSQPLLLTGEPGCGKSRLAWSIADELGLGDPLEFHTRSTSRAQDLLYQFDAVRRFYDIQAEDERVTDPCNYVTYGALGQAIVEGERRVVLIDEIDKAPRDFPNDLLNEFDRMRFEVAELEGPERVKTARIRPIVVITSNVERQLPLPFLRRCVFHHIQFPDRDKLVQIIDERLGPLDLDPELIHAAVDRFHEVRQIKGLSKQPATGELLTWLVALNGKAIAAGELTEARLGRLPLWQALLKDREDYDRLRQATA